MDKTDVEGICKASEGILVNVSKDSDYDKKRTKAIEEQRLKDRINTIENDISSIKELLTQILSKVN